MKTEIFTIDAFDQNDECSVTPMPLCVDYTDLDKAIADANELADDLADDDHIVTITVFGGEYRDDEGNVYGEPMDIYSASNKNKQMTDAIRKERGYCNVELDYYQK